MKLVDWVNALFSDKRALKRHRELIDAVRSQRQVSKEIVEAIRSIPRTKTNDIVSAINRQTSEILKAIEQQTISLKFPNLTDQTLDFFYEDFYVKFYIPDGDIDYVQRTIFGNRSFYEEPLLRHVRKTFNLEGKHVIDVGANIGNHTVYFSKICKVKDCLAFEPNPYANAILRRNIELNDLQNVRVRQEALSDSSSSLKFKRFRLKNLGNTTFEEDPEGSVGAVRLDDIEVSKLDFIKIDVEGMAHRVLAGAIETLRKHRPNMLIEVFEPEWEQCFTILQSVGYRKVEELGAGNYFFKAVE